MCEHYREIFSHPLLAPASDCIDEPTGETIMPDPDRTSPEEDRLMEERAKKRKKEAEEARKAHDEKYGGRSPFKKDN